MLGIKNILHESNNAKNKQFSLGILTNTLWPVNYTNHKSEIIHDKLKQNQNKLNPEKLKKQNTKITFCTTQIPTRRVKNDVQKIIPSSISQHKYFICTKCSNLFSNSWSMKAIEIVRTDLSAFLCSKSSNTFNTKSCTNYDTCSVQTTNFRTR